MATYPPQPQSTYPPTPAPYPSPFAAVVPSPAVFPPGTDPNAIACFQLGDQSGEGLIDAVELQKGLSLYHHTFSIRTVRLLIFIYTNYSPVGKIGPTEFITLYNSLKSWKAIFEKFDSDRSGKIDAGELGNALVSLGYAVSAPVLELLVTKYGCGCAPNRGIEYDQFIECCLIVKGLCDRFKEKDNSHCGTVTFTYESFLLTVLPFITV